jgi:hypothetical protein
MAERRSQPDVRLEYAFDRLLVAKLEQVYQILVPIGFGSSAMAAS